MSYILNLLLKQFYNKQNSFISKESFKVSKLIFLDKYLIDNKDLKIKFLYFIVEDLIENPHCTKSSFEKKSLMLTKIYKSIQKETLNKKELSSLEEQLENFQPDGKRISIHASRREIKDIDLFILELILYYLQSNYLHKDIYCIAKYYILDFGIESNFRFLYSKNTPFRYFKFISFFEDELYLSKKRIRNNDYKFLFWDKEYNNKKRRFIVNKAKKIAKRSKYIYKKFPIYNYDLLNKAIFLDSDSVDDKKLFYELNNTFVDYCWFINTCLYQNYSDDIVEFLHDCSLRFGIDKLLRRLNQNELSYIKKELFYLDLIYYILTDTKTKLKSTHIDNTEYNYKEVKDKKEHLWHLLYYPVNLTIPIHKDYYYG